jgi:hypothetical protein
LFWQQRLDSAGMSGKMFRMPPRISIWVVSDLSHIFQLFSFTGRWLPSFLNLGKLTFISRLCLPSEHVGHCTAIENWDRKGKDGWIHVWCGHLLIWGSPP